MVGLGSPPLPVYATDPRYFVPAARPVKVRLTVPEPPVVAAAGAVTVMLPTAADPSTHENSLKVAVPETLKPCTYTTYSDAAGLSRFTSSFEVPLPLDPTSVSVPVELRR